MAGYKVPQDVEAEDKFLGPLTFKQFLFAGGAAVSGYILFIFMTKGIWVGFALLFPIFAVFAILAFPWSKDQSTEIWLASRIRFMIMPRKRIWDQSGVKDLVTITVPKREIKHYTDGLSHDQVYNRVSALATMIDTRGWAVKNVAVGRQDIFSVNDDSDRLVEAPVEMLQDTNTALADAVNVMDHQADLLAAQFNDLMRRAEDQRKKARDDLLHHVHNDYPSSAAPAQATMPTLPSDQTTPDPALAAMQQNTPQQSEESSPPATSQQIAAPSTASTPSTDPVQPQPYMEEITLPPVQSTSTTPVDPAILQLSTNDDLTIATIARQAQKDRPDDEVVVSLR